jgi:hypothetical protein
MPSTCSCMFTICSMNAASCPWILRGGRRRRCPSCSRAPSVSVRPPTSDFTSHLCKLNCAIPLWRNGFVGDSASRDAFNPFARHPANVQDSSHAASAPRRGHAQVSGDLRHRCKLGLRYVQVAGLPVANVRKRFPALHPGGYRLSQRVSVCRRIAARSGIYFPALSQV